MTKGTPPPRYALRPEFVDTMRRFAKRFHNIEKARSRIQYAVARVLLDEWSSGGYEGELTKDEFYTEASRAICDTVGFALVSATGETVKIWCEVFMHFENAPEKLKRELPFAYFKNARTLYNNKYVSTPMAAISAAMTHELTADQMLRFFKGDEIPEPNVIEFRNKFSRPFWGLYGWLESANRNRSQMEWHINEIERLHNEDVK